MKRKVIKQGHDTLTITLPSKWAKKFGIKAGDELDLIEQKKSILINPAKDAEVGEISVDVRGFTIQLLWRYIISSYRAGYDQIKVIFEESAKDHKNLYTAFSYNTFEYIQSKDHLLKLSQIEAIQALVNRLIGIEIIDQKDNSCIIKEMSELSYKEFDNSLRRIFLIIKEMGSHIQQSLSGDKNGLKSIHMIDTHLDRFEDFCLRVLNKKGYVNFNKTSIVYSIIFLLEMIGDEYKEVSIKLLSSRNVSKKLTESIRATIVMFNNLYSLFYSFDKESLKKIYEEYNKINALDAKIFSEMGNNEKEMLNHITKVNSYIKSLVELRIDLEV